jgi:hypothetical protein
LQEAKLADKALLKEEDEKLEESGFEMNFESVGILRCVHNPYFCNSYYKIKGNQQSSF